MRPLTGIGNARRRRSTARPLGTSDAMQTETPQAEAAAEAAAAGADPVDLQAGLDFARGIMQDGSAERVRQRIGDSARDARERLRAQAEAYRARRAAAVSRAMAQLHEAATQQQDWQPQAAAAAAANWDWLADAQQQRAVALYRSRLRELLASQPHDTLQPQAPGLGDNPFVSLQ